MAQVDKIMSVYYGCDKLPYKDENREVHYPIASGVNNFIGENNTTKIRFYVNLIGGHDTTWVAIIKKNDGSLTYRLLDDIPNEDYVELSLTSFYLEYDGALIISLQGYNGGTNVVVNYDDGVYEISGTPTIICTGNVKIMVNYAPVVLNIGSEIQPNQYQQILAKLSQNVEPRNVVLRRELTPEDLDNYDLKQLILVLNQDKSIFKLYRVKQGSGTSHSVEEILDFADILGLQSDIDDINEVIPRTASTSNKLTTAEDVRNYVNNYAGYFVTKDASGNSFSTKAQLTSATTFYNGGTTRTPTRNDYCYVLADESHNNATTKYSYQGGTYPYGAWTFEVVVNETPMTQAQLNALNSGITAEKVAKILEKTNDNAKIYGTDANGNQTTFDWDSAVRANTFVKRDTSGRVRTEDPLGNYDAVNKKTMDAQIEDIREIATGRTKNFSLSYEWDEAYLEDFIFDYGSEQDYVVKYWNNNQWETMSYSQWLEWSENKQVENNIFNSQEVIDLETGLANNGYLIVSASDSVFYLLQRNERSVLFDLGSNVYVEENNVPDRWYDGFSSLLILETKDLTKTSNTFNQKQTFSGGVKTTYLTQDDTHQITPNKIIDSVGTTIKDTTHTTYSGGLNCANQYIFTRALTSISISALEYLVNDSYKVWNISFKVGSGFTFSMPHNKTYKFAEGEPIWDTNTTYTLLIQEGIDTDYIIYVARA